jgi:hypothetical protein
MKDIQQIKLVKNKIVKTDRLEVQMQNIQEKLII